MGGGKSSKTSSSVTIPPEVLARYNSVNAAAQQTAATPFQQYSTDPNAFVAPLTGTQQAGIANTNAAVGTAQPYYDQATGQLLSAQNSAVPFYSQGQSDVQGAQTVGDLLGSASYGAIAGAQAGAQPYNAAAGTDYQSAYDSAQPYNLGATGLAIAGAGAVDPSQLNSQSINQYLSPYLGTVLQGTAGILNQQNQQQQAGQLGNAISQGAFGGDRAGVAAANLEQQQNLANSQIYSGILNEGYNNALSTAQQQQQVGLGAAQANRAALQNASTQIQGLGQQQYSQGMGLGSAQQGLGQQTYAQGANTAQQLAALGQQQYGQGIGASQQEAALGSGLYGMGSNTSQGLANLGTASQTAALQGAQAQLGAGQVEQQTQQAGDTALYNQFLQQQSYPFQVDQFLANIAEGTGALSGSTTTTTQPGGFFSDERLKENIRPVGKTFDGQKIYAYNYKGDKRTQVGLIAQEVEKKHPEAVGGHMGFKTVDYGVATDKSAARGKFADGGPAYDPSWSGILDNASYNPKRGLGMAQTDPGSSSDGGNGLPFSGTTTGGGGKSSNSLNLQPLVQQAWDGINAGLVAKGEEPNSAQAPVIHWKSADGGRRGKAGGGLSLPGVDPNYIASLLQAQQQSYAPYSGGGLYGGQGGGSPRGGSSYVPSANLPVGQLAVSKVDPVAPQSGLSQVKQITDLANTVHKGVDSLHSKNAGVDPDEMDKALAGIGSVPMDFYRGGLVPHKADGGMNDDDPIDTYSDPFGPKLKIPNDHPTAKLQTAQPPQQSGSSGLGDILGIGKDIASIFAAANGGSIRRATGGRAHKADGGANDDDSWLGTLERAADLGRDTPIIGPILGAASDVSRRGLGAFGLGESSADAAPPKSYASGIGSVEVPLPPVSRKALNDSAGLGAATNASTQSYPAALDTKGLNNLELAKEREANVTPSNDTGSAGLGNVGTPSASPAIPSAPTGLVAPSGDTGPVTDANAGVAPTNRLNGILDQPSPAQSNTPQDKHSGIVDRIPHPNGRPDLILPILQGIAAMGTAPTRHLGVALAAGLGAGTQGYLKNQQQQADIAQTQAGVGQTKAQTHAIDYNVWKQQNPPPIIPGEGDAGWTVVPGPDKDGKSVIGPDGKTPVHWELSANAAGMHNAPGASPNATPGTPPPDAKAAPWSVGENGAQTAQQAQTRYLTATPPDKAQSAALKANMLDQYQASESFRPQLNKLASIVSAPNTGTLAPNFVTPFITPLVSTYNNVLARVLPDGANNPAYQKLAIDPTGMTSNQILEKMNISNAASGADAAGQKALGALQERMQAAAGMGHDRATNISIAASMYQANQMPWLLKKYADNLDQTKGGLPGNYLMQDVVPAFNADHNTAQFEHDRHTIEGLLDKGFVMNGHPLPFSKLEASLEAGGQRAKDAAALLDAAGGYKGFHTYFTGAD